MSKANTHKSNIDRVGDAGIYTAEGMTAGGKAARLAAKREKEKDDYEAKKKAIEDEKAVGSLTEIADKFTATSTTTEIEFKASTIGLKSASEYRLALDISEDASAIQARAFSDKATMAAKEARKRKRKELKKKSFKMLSFMDEEEDADDDSDIHVLPAKKIFKKLKDPTVKTDFLPDRERESTEKLERERLEVEWKKGQEIIKEEMLEVTYSFWDGSGHRRTIKISKGTSIGKFLELVRQQLASEFPELKGTHGENLMYIKEDLIIPHHYSFYYLILTKARGKSGPLFHFDVHEDVRMVQDVTVEKDESHPGKIVERRWYERNKHIFPASRWETFDPSVKRDRYTIAGDLVQEEK